ncbi:hypothetical protein HH308_20345 [Gordonia sp. TBRC 11910]|uniref:Uncharacterized protein n=1 Tax=Gordonia asplenii TaxID=2725283 RepID=A0A848KY34_9ACTN|nr:hypothetical protein [Gordonia asplenii]NMO03570.1 hypothetical protein [Gordonia asplenii]
MGFTRVTVAPQSKLWSAFGVAFGLAVASLGLVAVGFGAPKTVAWLFIGVAGVGIISALPGRPRFDDVPGGVRLRRIWRRTLIPLAMLAGFAVSTAWDAITYDKSWLFVVSGAVVLFTGWAGIRMMRNELSVTFSPESLRLANARFDCELPWAHLSDVAATRSGRVRQITFTCPPDGAVMHRGAPHAPRWVLVPQTWNLNSDALAATMSYLSAAERTSVVPQEFPAMLTVETGPEELSPTTSIAGWIARGVGALALLGFSADVAVDRLVATLAASGLIGLPARFVVTGCDVVGRGRSQHISCAGTIVPVENPAAAHQISIDDAVWHRPFTTLPARLWDGSAVLTGVAHVASGIAFLGFAAVVAAGGFGVLVAGLRAGRIRRIARNILLLLAIAGLSVFAIGVAVAALWNRAG